MSTPDAWHARNVDADDWRPGTVGLCGKRGPVATRAPLALVCRLPANHQSSHLYLVTPLNRTRLEDK